PRDLLSFPTRRSSDLSLADAGARFQLNQAAKKMAAVIDRRYIESSLSVSRWQGIPVIGRVILAYGLDVAIGKAGVAVFFSVSNRSEEHTSELQSQSNL